MKTEMMRIISLGLGVQSTALYLMSSLGQLPRADHAIFADTGKEAAATYRHLEFLQDWQRRSDGIPIAVRRDKNLYRDLLQTGSHRRFASIPAFTAGEDGSVGMLKRQCTYEYKIKIIDDYIRDRIYRLPKGSRRPPTELWHGISTDEIERMTCPREAWKRNTYPFLGYCVTHSGDCETLPWARPMSRQELIRWYALSGLALPPKSSCVFCPYQSDNSWAYKKNFAPEDFRAAVRVDEAIRNSTRQGINRPVFLHRSCRPLAEVAFDSRDSTEYGECSGACHV